MDLTFLEMLFMGLSVSVTGFCSYKIGRNSSRKPRKKKKRQKEIQYSSIPRLYDISVLKDSFNLKVGDHIPAIAFVVNLSGLQELQSSIQSLESSLEKLSDNTLTSYRNFLKKEQEYASLLKKIKRKGGLLSEKIYIPDFINTEYSIHKFDNYQFISDGKDFYIGDHLSLLDDNTEEISLRAGNILSQIAEISQELEKYKLLVKTPDEEIVAYTEKRIKEAEDALSQTMEELTLFDEIKETQENNENTINLMDKATKMTF